MKVALANLAEETKVYISDYAVVLKAPKPVLDITLKYFEGKPVIDSISRESAVLVCVFTNPTVTCLKLWAVWVWLLYLLPRALMSDRAARKAGIGGEVICFRIVRGIGKMSRVAKAPVTYSCRCGNHHKTVRMLRSKVKSVNCLWSVNPAVELHSRKTTKSPSVLQRWSIQTVGLRLALPAP